MEYTEAQKNRLIELGVSDDLLDKEYSDKISMQESFHELEKKAIRTNRQHLSDILSEEHKVSLCKISEKIAAALCENGFTQVATPTIISLKALEKMTITSENPLYDQVFFIDSKSALRPMLAPNLYEVSKQLMNSQKLPLRIFEIGSCFRKESEGKNHLKEFTMCNLVEWGTPMEERVQHLKEFAAIVLKAAEIDDYKLEEEDSVVYGLGLDVVSSDGLELASTSMGPHRLDDAWKINCSWVGIGFGLERLLMIKNKQSGIHRYSRSTTFMDGACLKLK